MICMYIKEDRQCDASIVEEGLSAEGLLLTCSSEVCKGSRYIYCSGQGHLKPYSSRAVEPSPSPGLTVLTPGESQGGVCSLLSTAGTSVSLVRKKDPHVRHTEYAYRRHTWE